MKRRERVIRTTCLSQLSFCKTLLVLKKFCFLFLQAGRVREMMEEEEKFLWKEIF